MKFKYSEYQAKDKTIFRPTIPITFKYKSQSIQVEALIDSGADFTILPIEIADYLKINIDQDLSRTVQGAGNNVFNVYHSTVKVEHQLHQTGFRSLQWSTYVYFADHQPTILLGNMGFIERFRITLDGKRKEIEIN